MASIKQSVSARRDFWKCESSPKNLFVKAERLESAEHVPAVITLEFLAWFVSFD